MLLLKVIGERLVPSMARTTGNRGLPLGASSSWTAFSVALRLVVAHRWGASASAPTHSAVQEVLAVSFMNLSGSCTIRKHDGSSACSRHAAWGRTLPRRGVVYREPLWLDRGNTKRCYCCSSALAGAGGSGTGGRRRRYHISHELRAYSFESVWNGGGSVAETGFHTPASRNFGSTAAVACSRSVSDSDYSAVGVVSGDSDVAEEYAGSAAGNGDVGGEDGGRKLPSTAAAAVPSKSLLKSLSTARDRGDVKYKKRREKPTKGQVEPAGQGSNVGSPGTGRKLVRLSKLLADRAIGTRSEVDALVRRGKVQVDGAVVRSPKTKLPVDSVIEVNGVECRPVPLLVAFHKPKGVITTVSDDWDRKDLSDALPKSLLRRHHPVGRLDADSSGLLLLSSDGALTHRLLNPRFEVEREYVATVDVPQGAEEPGDSLVAALREGIATADGVYKADVPEIDGRNVRVVVREGKNRMVRRMLANAGYPVLELRRERYGNILLGDLAQGEHIPVSGGALEWANSIYQLQVAPAAAGGASHG